MEIETINMQKCPLCPKSCTVEELDVFGCCLRCDHIRGNC